MLPTLDASYTVISQNAPNEPSYSGENWGLEMSSDKTIENEKVQICIHVILTPNSVLFLLFIFSGSAP